MTRVSIAEFEYAKDNFERMRRENEFLPNFNYFLAEQFPCDNDKSPNENYYTFSPEKAAFIKALSSPHHKALLKVWEIKNASNQG